MSGDGPAESVARNEAVAVDTLSGLLSNGIIRKGIIIITLVVVGVSVILYLNDYYIMIF